MSAHVEADTNRTTTALTRTGGLRRSAFAAFVTLLIQYGFGIYVNLYAVIPAADHGHGVATAIANGPIALSVHAALGMFLILAAFGLCVQSAIARRWAVMAAAVVALAAITGAAVQGASFVSRAQPAASMGMAALAGVALLSYGTALYLLPGHRTQLAR